MSPALKWGVMSFVWLGGAALMAIIFLWQARTFLFLRKDGHEVKSLTGRILLKPSGNKNEVLTIGEMSFFLRKTDVRSMNNGQEYTIYYIEAPKTMLGYVHHPSQV